ncbi:amino acid ABC transporter permease [Laceyella sacchari]|jgi:L-cystine transport system permease protein|uniref:Amino acid ABC transporter permease n=1 Tax=Laceyella sacchari TaxID=37482 RepID=A0ABY5U527_LACSH|nr:amino acid ABC transporter permease [Laceyella sacchari]TCW41151.1 amino acid ABC transporter membrane protein (PAAT family) [Laceyella sacchari]UWE04738.1 amino acid ABC transporter permease [Laceyella sacchari]
MEILRAIRWESLFDVELAIKAAPQLLIGLMDTIWISLLTMAIGLVLGLLTAMARMSNNPLFRYPARAYISLIRGTPLLVQIFILYFGLPVIGITLTPLLAGIIGLSFNVGAYSAETIRGSILSIPKGQWEAAASLNMTYWQTMRRVIIPQATRVALPSLANTFMSLVKDTSLLAMITVQEMFYQAKVIGAREWDYMTVFIMIALFYWVVCTLLSFAQDKLEERYGRYAS